MEFDPNSNPPCYKTKEEVLLVLPYYYYYAAFNVPCRCEEDILQLVRLTFFTFTVYDALVHWLELEHLDCAI